MSEVAKNISTAVALKEQGNSAFKEGDYAKAMVAYHQIYMYVNGYSSGGGGGGLGLPGSTTKEVSPQEMAQISELKVAHHSNLAMCHMKQGLNYAKARDNCTKALLIDPDNVKARFRRGKCYAQLNAIDEAKADFDRVLQLQPDNNDAKRELRALRGAFEKVRKKEQKKFAGMFDRIQLHHESDDAVGSDGIVAADDSSIEDDAHNDGISLPCGSEAPRDAGEMVGEHLTFSPADFH
jgi:tetratricopeptide (TPR) repeat protein